MRGRETEPTSIQGVDYTLPNKLVACGYGLTAGVIVGEVGFQIGVHRSGDRHPLT